MDCYLKNILSPHLKILLDLTPEAPLFQRSRRQAQRLKTKTHFLLCSAVSLEVTPAQLEGASLGV